MKLSKGAIASDPVNRLEKLYKIVRPPQVSRLQEILSGMGFPVEISGVYCVNTKHAVIRAQKFLGLLDDGVCGPVTWQKLIEYNCQCQANTDPGPAYNHDIRGQHGQPKLYERERAYSEIDGITWHQTSCDMPKDPMRWGNVNVHGAVLREGRPLLINPVTDFVWHAQRLSRRSIGIEIEGNFRGLTNKSNTLWKPGGGPHHLTQEMIDAAFWLTEYYCNKVNSHGGSLKYMFAHRQSSDMREADPGQEIWESIVIPAAEKFGLRFPSGNFKVGSGKPVPREWQPGQPTRYWE